MTIFKICKEFIYNHRHPPSPPPKKTTTLINNTETHDLKDADIPSKITSLQCFWIKRLFDTNFPELKIIPLYSFPLRHWNTGLVSSGDSLTSCREVASLALVGHPSNDGVTLKITYGIDVLLH